MKYKTQCLSFLILIGEGNGFIGNQPENPWSLDRGMNGVMSQAHIFLLKT